MTGFSSSVYEAYHMGIHAVMFDKNALDYYKDYIESGIASYYSNVDDILNFIKKHTKNQGVSSRIRASENTYHF
jgi:hypothetical protein